MPTIRLNELQCSVDKFPDTCPQCQFKIAVTPRMLSSRLVTGFNEMQVVYKCNNNECQSLFISNYVKDTRSAEYNFFNSVPSKLKIRIFDKVIETISQPFIVIYSQAEMAEKYGLTMICGAGYRKALEFLVKDYVISKQPLLEPEIKAQFLSTVIKQYVSDLNVKEIADRAVWLGNDETHYERKWTDHDLQDLKGLIDITLYWILNEHRTAEVLAKMPRPVKN